MNDDDHGKCRREKQLVTIMSNQIVVVYGWIGIKSHIPFFQYIYLNNKPVTKQDSIGDAHLNVLS